MSEVTIEVAEARDDRQERQSAAALARRSVPGVVYGAGKDTVPIRLDRKTLVDLLKKGGSENADLPAQAVGHRPEPPRHDPRDADRSDVAPDRCTSTSSASMMDREGARQGADRARGRRLRRQDRGRRCSTSSPARSRSSACRRDIPAKFEARRHRAARRPARRGQGPEAARGRRSSTTTRIASSCRGKHERVAGGSPGGRSAARGGTRRARGHQEGQGAGGRRRGEAGEGKEEVSRFPFRLQVHPPPRLSVRGFSFPGGGARR